MFQEALGQSISKEVNVSMACTALAQLYQVALIQLKVKTSHCTRFIFVAGTILHTFQTDTTFTVHQVPVQPVVVFVPVVYVEVQAFTNDTVSTNHQADVVSTLHFQPLASIVKTSQIVYQVHLTTGVVHREVIQEAR
jgi:hypothetical protein